MAIVLIGCSDKVVVLKETLSADGSVKAQFVKYMYGGAAGGRTYCVSLSYGSKGAECVLAGSHINSADLSWSGHNLVFTYCGGQITNNQTNDPKVVPAGWGLSIIQSCNLGSHSYS